MGCVCGGSGICMQDRLSHIDNYAAGRGVDGVEAALGAVPAAEDAGLEGGG